MIQIHASSLNTGDVVVGWVDKTRKGWIRREHAEIEILPNADLKHFESCGENRQWLVLDREELALRTSRPAPIHRDSLWLHMDSALHPETDCVIDAGTVYRNVGIGFIEQCPATSSDYGQYARVID